MGFGNLVKKLVFKQGSDRRKYPRVPLSVKVTKMSSGAFQFNRASNISVGGAFVKAVEPLPIGTKLTVKITLPGGDVEVEAEVVRVMLEGESPSGMGLRFIALPPEIRARIEEYVAKEM